MKREKRKGEESVHDETVMLSLVFPVFHYRVGIGVPPFEKGGEEGFEGSVFSYEYRAI